MACIRRKKGNVACRKWSFLSLGASLWVICSILLLLQAGCQEQASAEKSPVTGKDPAPIAEPKASTTVAVPSAPTKQAVAEAVQEAKPEAAPSPRIVLENAVHDFGDIGAETKHSAQFKFKNAGDAPLKITRVKSCCGVATRGVKAGQEYAPGQSGALEIDYSASFQPGDVSRKLYMQTNDPAQSVVTLSIKATIVRRVDYTPKRLKLFLKRDNAGAEDITLTSLDGKPFSVKAFRATANAITAEFDPATKATTIILKPKADMEKLGRNLKGQISIDLTHPECDNIRLLFDVLPQFTVNPPQIMLFNLKADQPVRREIWVLGNYEGDFEIESVTSQKGIVKLVDSKKVAGTASQGAASSIGTRYQLQIEITPPEAKGERSVLSDVLEVKIKDGETLSIQCRGFY